MAFDTDFHHQRSLLKRARAGEPEAFARLARQYRGLVFAICFEHTGHFGDSEDLTQEVLLTAYRSLSSLREQDKLAGWLRGIARNLCLMHLRSSRTRVLPDSSTRTEPVVETARAVELQNLLRGALTQVSDRNREVLSLHYLGGYSYAEIATLCELPVPLVRSRLYEGRAQLKTRLLETVAKLCQCSQNAEHTAQCVLKRCGSETCACVSLLMAV